jgi:CRISPR/Cas system-associated protein Cas10 (large subunit of type III CRISPR-Cas system)
MDHSEELKQLLVELSNARRLRRRQLLDLKNLEPGDVRTSLERDAEENAARIRHLVKRRRTVGRLAIKSLFSKKRRPPSRRRRAQIAPT